MLILHNNWWMLPQSCLSSACGMQQFSCFLFSVEVCGLYERYWVKPEDSEVRAGNFVASESFSLECDTLDGVYYCSQEQQFSPVPYFLVWLCKAHSSSSLNWWISLIFPLGLLCKCLTLVKCFLWRRAEERQNDFSCFLISSKCFTSDLSLLLVLIDKPVCKIYHSSLAMNLNTATP